MQASAGACLLLHLRCTSRGDLQITGFTHHRLCGVKILHVLALSPTLSFPRQIRQPCLKDLLWTRKAMTCQFLVELPPRTVKPLQFTSGFCSAANDIFCLELCC